MAFCFSLTPILRRPFISAFPLFLVCICLAFVSGCGGRDNRIYPQEHWEWKPPESSGFSREKLNAFAEKAGGTGLIVQGGELIYEWGDTRFPNDIASASKFVYTFLTLLAIEDGLIKSLDDPVISWAPELQDLNADLGYKDRDITFRQLLNQTSGYGLTDQPGDRFAYNDHATGLLAWILFYRVFGLTPPQYDEILNSTVFREWIGFEHPFTALHRNTPRGRLRISARDLARLGLLHLRNGRWENKQIVNKDLFEYVFSASLPMDLPRTRGVDAEEIPAIEPLGGGKNEKNHLGSLGYFWWQNTVTSDGYRLIEAATPDTRLAMGHGGKFAMTLIPEDDLIIIWFGVYPEEVWSPFDEIGRIKVNQMLEKVFSARHSRPSAWSEDTDSLDPF